MHLETYKYREIKMLANTQLIERIQNVDSNQHMYGKFAFMGEMIQQEDISVYIKFNREMYEN